MDPGINITKLKPGTKVVVQTLHSTYELKVIEDNKVLVKGGRYFPELVERHLLGSTWGGSMLKLNWIGQDMHMEFTNPPRNVVTSRVQSATIYGDGWFYSVWD